MRKARPPNVNMSAQIPAGPDGSAALRSAAAILVFQIPLLMRSTPRNLSSTCSLPIRRAKLWCSRTRMVWQCAARAGRRKCAICYAGYAPMSPLRPERARLSIVIPDLSDQWRRTIPRRSFRRRSASFGDRIEHSRHARSVQLRRNHARFRNCERLRKAAPHQCLSVVVPCIFMIAMLVLQRSTACFCLSITTVLRSRITGFSSTIRCSGARSATTCWCRSEASSSNLCSDSRWH